MTTQTTTDATRRAADAPRPRARRAGERANIFLCFAPEDRDFARDLDEALRKRRRVSGLNWHGPSPGGDAAPEALKRIEGADTFVFVVSPSSVASEVCRRQLEQAARLRKVIVPVVRAEVAPELLPPPLASLPAIDYRPEADFLQAFEQVIRAVNTNLRIDVFVCYSREDGEFVRKLYQRLDEDGRRVWLDVKNIAASTLWEREIFAGIEAADNFIFVISPSSVRPGSFCHKELAHAVANNKRVIPLCHRPVADAEVPPVLAQYQREDFTAGRKFDLSFDNLVSVLDQDPAYLREHTRLLTRSIEWQRSDDGGGNRDQSLLLRGGDLTRAEDLLETSANKRPQFTNLQTQYVVASRKGANRSRNRLLAGAGAALVLLALLSVGLFFQTRTANAATYEAKRQQGIAEEQRTEATKQRDIARQKQKEAEDATTEANTQRDIAKDEKNKADQARIEAEKRRVEAENERRRAVEAADAERRAREVSEIRGLRAEAGRLEAAEKPLDALVVNRAADELASSHSEERNSGELSRLLQQASVGVILDSRQFKARLFAVSADGRKVAAASGDGLIHVWDVGSGRLDRVITAYQKEVTGLAFSPTDARLLASAGADTLETVVKTWDVETGHEGTPLPEPGYCCGGRRLQFIGSDRLFSGEYLWDLRAGRRMKLNTPAGTWLETVAVSHDGKKAAVGLIKSGTPPRIPAGAAIYDLSTGQQMLPLAGPPEVLERMAFSADGWSVAAATVDHVLRIWDTSDGSARVVKDMDKGIGERPLVDLLEFAPEGSDLVTTSSLGVYGAAKFVVWNSLVPDYYREVAAHEGPIIAFKFSPDGKRLVTASDDHTAAVWDTRRWVRIQTLRGHQGRVEQLAFLPDGGIVSGSADGALRVWRPLDKVVERPLQHVYDIKAMSEDGRLAAVYPYAGPGQPDSSRVVVYDVESARPLGTVQPGQGPMSFLFSRDDKRLAAVLPDLTVNVWEVDGGRPVGTLPGFGPITMAPTVFSGDMTRAANTNGSRVRVADLDGGRLLLDLDVQAAHRQYLYADKLAMSPDGSRLAVGYNVNSGQGLVEVYRYSPGAGRYQLEAEPGGNPLDVGATSLAFSADGRFLAIGGGDGALTLRDNLSGRLGAPGRAHRGSINSIVWPRDGGGLLATLSKGDNTVRVWRASPSLSLAQTLERGIGIEKIVISNDGTRLLSASGYRVGAGPVLRVWDTATGNLLDELEMTSTFDSRPSFLADPRRVRFYDYTNVLRDWLTQPTAPDLGRQVGASTNLRVCRDTYRVVPVLPYPGPDVIWAPPEYCGGARREKPAGGR